jgi:protein O-GlcNAc transferase
MLVSNRPEKERRPPSTQAIRRAIWITLFALVFLLLVFGGYYVWDRYVHLGDKSPLELDIERMESAIRQDSQNPDARVVLAEYYLNRGMYEKALGQTDQVLSLYPENEGALLISGIAHVRLNQPAAVLDPLEKFVALRQDRSTASIDTALETAYYFLGESYVKLGRPADAIRVLEAALTISSTDADALYQVGLAYQAMGQPQAALERYHKAVRLVPDFAEVYRGMIESYAALNQPDYGVYARGMEAFSLQDFESALTQLEQASRALQDFGPAFLGLGLTYEKTGQLEAALVAIQRALELNPHDFAAQQALGRIQAILNSQG